MFYKTMLSKMLKMPDPDCVNKPSFLDYSLESMGFPGCVFCLFTDKISYLEVINVKLFPQLSGRLRSVQRCETVLHVVLQRYWS